MALAIPRGLALELISDPVMAAYVLMGAELDVFQAARLRTWWFTPEVIDHSGVSTAKSEMAFIWACLRCLLLPNPGNVARIVSVYYQGKSTAEEVFLPKIDKYCQKSGIFKAQIKVQRGGGLYKKLLGCFVVEFRNGARIELPAGDFARDSKNQASKRFNDLLIDETGEIDKMGRGINTQLLQRNTLECFNPFHPVWCNHTVFLGHAEGEEHPYYRRFTKMRRKIRRGSQNHATITSCFEDYRGKHRKSYGSEAIKKANDQRGSLTEAEFAWIWLGLWKKGSKGWYAAAIRTGIERSGLRPEIRRTDPRTIYTLGGDFAPGLHTAADWNSYVVNAGTPLGSQLPAEYLSDPLGIVEINGTYWWLRTVFAIFLHGRDVDQLSGAIHLLHQGFNFAAVCLDPGGGGAWVYKKLREAQQLINGQTNTVRGLCWPRDAWEWKEAEPIVHFFDRGDEFFRPMFGERYLKDNSGPIDFAHTKIRSLMSAKNFSVPAPVEKWSEVERGGLTEEEQGVIATLQKVMSQYGAIGVKVNKEGLPVLSEQGFRKFDAGARKKDGAMADIYSKLALIRKIEMVKGPVEDEMPDMMVFN